MNIWFRIGDSLYTPEISDTILKGITRDSVIRIAADSGIKVYEEKISINERNSDTNNNFVKVGYVVPNSPADKSGISVGDIIIKVGNKDIQTASEVISQISKNGINKKINILLKRKNKFISFKVIPTDITNLENK